MGSKRLAGRGGGPPRREGAAEEEDLVFRGEVPRFKVAIKLPARGARGGALYPNGGRKAVLDLGDRPRAAEKLGTGPLRQDRVSPGPSLLVGIEDREFLDSSPRAATTSRAAGPRPGPLVP